MSHVGHIIRRLEAADIGAYRAICQKALIDHPEAFSASPDSFAERGDADLARTLDDLTVFGVEHAELGLGGIMAFMRNDGVKDGHKGWVLQVYVRPELRGTGCARALLDHLVAHARQHVRQLHLGVWTENTAAIALYEKAGFEIYGTEPRYLFVNGRYVDEHLMVRFLDR